VSGHPVTGQAAAPPFPTLTLATPRLQVRPVEPGDAAAVAPILADKQTQRWLPTPAGDGAIDLEGWFTRSAGGHRASGDGDHYVMVRREDDHVVGCLWTKRTDWLARSTELACAVAPPVRGFGLAPEAVDALAIALLLEHSFQRVELRVAPGNVASRRVAEKAGFTYEGLLRNAGHVRSGRVDLEVWSFVPADLG
jgi:[ribosomal protein S5]-alanine N-acetyltransferase